VKPEINAVCTVMIVIVAAVVVLAARLAKFGDERDGLRVA
jgi:ABC-type spermidine/putrescine transport system permease subunit II